MKSAHQTPGESIAPRNTGGSPHLVGPAVAAPVYRSRVAANQAQAGMGNGPVNRPPAPPVYRPEPAKVSSTAPPVYRPVQRKIVPSGLALTAQLQTPGKAPVVYRPQAKQVNTLAGGAVLIQPKMVTPNAAGLPAGAASRRVIQAAQDQIGLFLYDREGKIKQGMSPKEELVAIGSPKNPGQQSGVGKYVYHSTSLKNLVTIQRVGLDPDRGGGSGGSCELCQNEPLKKTSIKNSKGVIAVAVDRLTMGTYINQRENYAERTGLSGDTSVLLRFKVSERHQRFANKQKTISSTWRKDPDDLRAFQLIDIKIEPGEIECLTTDGWVPLLSLKNLHEAVTEEEPYNPNSQDGYQTFKLPRRPKPSTGSKGILL